MPYKSLRGSGKTGFEATHRMGICTSSKSSTSSAAPCAIQSVRWDPADKAVDGTVLTLHAAGTPECAGKTMQFEVYEDDSPGAPDLCYPY